MEKVRGTESEMEMEMERATEMVRATKSETETERETEIDSFYMDHVCDSNLVEFPCPCRICKQMINRNEFNRGVCRTCVRQGDIDHGDCSFIIHKSCAKTTPRHIRDHPLHPQHDLALSSGHNVSSEEEDICNACGDNLKLGFVYKCTSSDPLCSFTLDVKCAFLTLTKETNNIELDRVVNDQGAADLRLHGLHPHRLISCNMSESFSYFCTCCKLSLIDKDESGPIRAGASTTLLDESGPIRAAVSTTLLVCLECKALLHKTCAEIPWNIEKHPFHPSHPLVLLPRVPSPGPCFECHLCRQTKQDGFAYHCQDCGIFLDVCCASLKPRRKNPYEDDSPKLGHFHPLIFCEKQKYTFPRFSYACGACGHNLSYWDSIYFCHECECLLDKSCADGLAQDINHVLHPDHKLTFWYRPLLSGYRKCRVCLSIIGDSGYECSKCAFYLDIKCARWNPHVLTSPLHRNLLILRTAPDLKQRCNVCKQRCHTWFLHSLAMDFVIHVQCLKTLPTEVKSPGHRHPLTLRHSPIKDHPDEVDDGEFYCNCCDERLQLWDPYYCCEQSQCDYVAHPQCVVDEVDLFGTSTKTTFQDFRKFFTSDETMEVESVLQAYEEMDKPNWLYDSHTATKNIGLPDHKLIRTPWEYWDAKSQVIEIETGIWILEEFAPLLKALFRKYGDFCSSSNLTPYPKMLFVTTVCEVLQNMSITNVTDVTKNLLLTWFQGFALGKHVGFDMVFAFDRLMRVATAYFGLHASLFVDPNFARVRDGEVAERRATLLDAEESEECTNNVDDSLIRLGKFALHDELKDLGTEREELGKTLKEKRSMYEWKKEWLTDTLDLLREKAFVIPAMLDTEKSYSENYSESEICSSDSLGYSE